MPLEFYKDDAMTGALKQAERFVGPGNAFTLSSLTELDIQYVYKYSSSAYTKLALTTDYSIVGSSIELVAYLMAGEHIVVTPNDDLDLTFVGPESAVRSQTKKLVIHKTGAYVYDDLKLYSEDLTVAAYEHVETINGSGFQVCSLNGLGIYDKNGIELTDSNAVGLQLPSAVLTADVSYGYPAVAVVVNGLYIGNVRGNSADVIALPLGTTIPAPNYTTDIVEVLSTGTLTFALDATGTVPADDAFKPLLVVPTLTAAAPTQKIWLRGTATIPAVTTELPNMPFKLTGQEYAE